MGVAVSQDISKFYRVILDAVNDGTIREKSGESRDHIGSSRKIELLDFWMNRHYRRQLSAMVDNIANGAGAHANKHGLAEFQNSVAFLPPKNTGRNRQKYRLRRRKYL